jgi:DNA primase
LLSSSGSRPERHQDAQRLIEPLAVVNPYSHRLTFLDDRTRSRRDHEKYLTLIDTIALLHQHQRVVRSAEQGQVIRYVQVTLEDIALANALAHEILGRTLDELPPQTRRLLGLLIEMVERSCAEQQTTRAQHRFSRRRVREHTRWGDTQLRIHLSRLVELEYLLVHRGGRGRGQSFEYELLYDGAAHGDAAHVSGLIDVEALRHAYDGQRSGSPDTQSAPGRGAVGTRSVGGQDPQSASLLEENRSSRVPSTNGAGNAYPRPRETVASYAPVAS